MADNTDFFATDIERLFDDVDFDRSGRVQQRVWERVAPAMQREDSRTHKADVFALSDDALELLSAAGDLDVLRGLNQE